MTAYYTNEIRRAALREEALSWIGTPFRENCAKKGRDGGVDCVHYLCACHCAAGAAPMITLPDLPVEAVRHWHEHHAESKIMDWLGAPVLRGRVRRLDEEEAPQCGDMAVLRIGLSEHHVGLWLPPLFAHVAIPCGVIMASIHDPSLRRLVRCFYRLYDVS